MSSAAAGSADDRHAPAGLALTGLLSAFMAGVAANVSAFNTVVTYDLVEPYWKRDRDDAYYLRFGRIATVVGIVISVFTALIASSYTNIMNYIQVLFSVCNVPLYATFIIGMFWKRMTPWAGFWGWWPAAPRRSAPICSTRPARSASAPTWPRRATAMGATVLLSVFFI